MIVSGDIVGGLGNHLFIIAAVLAYSLKTKKNIVFKYEENLGNRYDLPRKTFWKTLFKNQFELIESTKFDKIMFQPLFEKHSHIYQTLPTTHRNILLKGYFQSFKYINDDIKKRMIDIIYSNQDLMYNAYEKYNKIKSYFSCDDNDMVSVHVRRTDYCYGNFHKALEQNYYQCALEIANKKNIVIFSDDIEWCKQNINKSWYEYDNIYFVEDLGNNDDENINVELEFLLMSMFQHNIIANSTFSLWASFISTYQEPKIVIAPKQWFGPEGPKDWEQIYHKNITNII
jgi:hypothetical protein